MLLEICLPVKDEEKILAASLEKILDYCDRQEFSFSWKIVGLSNGSHDRTLEIFTDFKKRYPEKVDYRELALPGRGRALREYWSESQADIVCYMDIDLAVPLEEIPNLILPLVADEADLVIGSRLLKSSQTRRSYFREIISQIFNFLAHRILPNKVSDLQCGFKAARTDFFRKIEKFLVDDYWFFDTEIVMLCQVLGYRCLEIPVAWEENRFGKRASKVKIIRDSYKFFKDMIKLRRRLKHIRGV